MLKLIFISFLLMNNVILARASHYDTLGISKQATLPEIREAYKKLAMKFHPDKNPNHEDQQNFLEITEAYETLKDRQKRLHYDVLGSHSYTRTYNFQAKDYEHKFYNGLYYDDPNVDTLSGGNFSDYFQDGCYFINFYSPFCPPCQVLSEHWKKLAELYKGIVKVAAVNCKYHNSLCSETIKIRQYPSLLFYSIGITATANYTYYQGAYNFDSLDRYVLNYLKTRVRVATVHNVMSIQSPVAYVLDAKKIGVTAIYRIAYHLNKIVTVVTVKDHSLRAKLTKDKDTTVVVRYNGINKEIQSKKEKHVLTDIVESLPRVEDIDPEEFQTIRTNLLGVHGKSWVLHLSSKGRDRLLLYRLKMEFPDVNYGEIDCGRWKDLCVSLEMETLPAWGILKVDGAFQLVPSDADVRIYIEAATISDVIRPVSASTIEEIVRGKKGPWVLLVIPHKMHCHRTFEAFTKLSKMYSFSKDIRFGIVSCTEDTEAKCRKVHLNKPSIMGLTHNARRYFDGYPLLTDLIEYIQEILYIPDVELNESQVMEIIGESDRAVSWMLAFMPAGCGHECEELMKEWKIAAAKLGPLQSVRVGALQCASAAGLCANVRAPTARLYPALATEYHSNKLQLIAKAELMMEWALELLDDSIQTLDVKSFQRTVGSVETSDKPWIVYFHSPSCYRCHEMYKDFVLTSIFLKTKVHAAKVDCSAYREMCRRESVNAYPSLQLYLAGRPHRNSNSILITVEHYVVLLNAVTHLIKLHEDPISAVETDRVRHDEL